MQVYLAAENKVARPGGSHKMSTLLSSHGFLQQLTGADAEAHIQTLHLGNHSEEGEKDCGSQRVEDTKRTRPTESTKQSSQGSTETEGQTQTLP